MSPLEDHQKPCGRCGEPTNGISHFTPVRPDCWGFHRFVTKRARRFQSGCRQQRQLQPTSRPPASGSPHAHMPALWRAHSMPPSRTHHRRDFISRSRQHFGRTRRYQQIKRKRLIWLWIEKPGRFRAEGDSSAESKQSIYVFVSFCAAGSEILPQFVVFTAACTGFALCPNRRMSRSALVENVRKSSSMHVCLLLYRVADEALSILTIPSRILGRQATSQLACS